LALPFIVRLEGGKSTADRQDQNYKQPDSIGHKGLEVYYTTLKHAKCTSIR